MALDGCMMQETVKVRDLRVLRREMTYIVPYFMRGLELNDSENRLM